MNLKICGKLLVVLPFVSICAMYSIFLFDVQAVQRLTREDGVVETIGAVMFLLSSIVFGFAYFLRLPCSREHHMDQMGLAKKNIFYLLLSLFFLLAFLEEISWGQRMFEVETPRAIAKINRQGEINIHNLQWFHGLDSSGRAKPSTRRFLCGDRIFSYFWFLYCVCIPLLDKYNQRARGVFDRIRLPMVPLHYALLFPVNYIAQKLMTASYPSCGRGAVETKEAVFAILFACVAFGQVYRLSRKTSAAHAQLRSTSLMSRPCG
jgi:hypothetical protein